MTVAHFCASQKNQKLAPGTNSEQFDLFSPALETTEFFRFKVDSFVGPLCPLNNYKAMLLRMRLERRNNLQGASWNPERSS